VRARIRFKAHNTYGLEGIDLNCLVSRMNERLEGDELRDWQNRLALAATLEDRLDELAAQRARHWWQRLAGAT
jgi:hypothetical protein